MKNNKIDLFFILIISTILVWGAFTMINEKVNFDPSYKISLKENTIQNIYNEDGYWTWNNKEYNFYNDYSFSLNKNERAEFCKIVNSSNIQDIVEFKPKEWLYIYIKEKNADKIIVLKQNNKREVYFEFEDNMYEGKELEKYIHKHIKPTKTDRLKKIIL